jgi:protein phosphatase
VNAVALSVGKLTHIGQVRSRNEDAMDLRQAEKDEDPSLFIVADGMGGHSAGNVASQMAVEQTLSRFFQSTGSDLSERLRHAIEEANREIYQAAQSNADYFRMGTTIVGAAVIGNQADIANVGDSRVYLVRNGLIQQVTRDHSWVALQVEMGELTPEEAQVSQNRSVLLRCLGEKIDVLVDMVSVRLRKGDILILCTDGLHGLVNPDEIRSAVTSAEPQKACDDLVALANARGGVDNITVQVVRIESCPDPPPDEGEEIVIKRLAHSDAVIDDGPAPGPPPVPPSAPMYASPAANSPPSYAPPPPPDPVSSVPWLLIVLALLAGAIVMAVVDRLYMRPVSDAPEPGLSTTLPALPGPEASSASAEPSGPESAAPSALPSPVASSAIGSPAPLGAGEEGKTVVDRKARIQSPTVYRNALYWIEDGAIYHLPLEGAENRPTRLLTRGRARALAASASGLYAGLDDQIARLEVIRGTVAPPLPITSTAAPVSLLAAGEDAVYWVEEGSREILSAPLDRRFGRGGATPSVAAGSQRVQKKDAEDLVGLAVPEGSNALFWGEEGNGLHGGTQERPLVAGPIGMLAANARWLFWTEDSKDKDGTTRLRRAHLDGSSVSTLGTVRGPVSALAADAHAVYWVVSRPEMFSIRTLSLK